MREIVLDTETTGLNPFEGDRLVEIGCCEMLNHVTTGRTYHVYINPERDVPEEAYAIHGLSSDFLSGHPVFAEIVGDFLDFVADAPLIIHNAEFDMRFLNAELERAGQTVFPANRAIDTLALTRRKFPGSPASLDALCRRFGIDNSNRTFHGALLDAELLAECYLELCGGRQPGLTFDAARTAETGTGSRQRVRYNRTPRVDTPSDEEKAAHAMLLDQLKEPIWRST